MTQVETTTRDRELNRQIQEGDLLAAFEEFYADDVVMREGADEPIVGKDVNRKREEEFVASVEAVNKVELIGEAASGERSYSEWVFDLTFKGGQRVSFRQVAARRWRGGKVVEETFYQAK